VNIGLHIISDLEVPPTETMPETFKVLEKAEVLDIGVAERMSKDVGFRNIAVHAYQELDWHIVFKIATSHLDDFKGFARQILECAE
jgi:uncharacterized protein YutE (UPF0331/DUF86 family)